MSVIHNNALIGSSGQATGYNLTKSLRFRSSASAYLNRTPSVTGNQQKFTVSTWIKLSGTNDFNIFAGPSSGDRWVMGIGSIANGGQLDVGFNVSGTWYDVYTTQVFRDPSAWYHVIWAVDTTQATASNRYKVYVNGVQITSFAGGSYCPQNTNTTVNTAVLHKIGNYSTGYSDGYLAEYNFIDGQQLTPTSFGSTNATTGVWQPAKYTGTYGTNGFYLPFTNTTSTTTLGYDSSGNGNNWTTNNFSLTSGATYDSMTDVPTLTSATAANYSTFNPVGVGGGSLSNGNLRSSTSSSIPDVGTMAMLSGKWYCEITVTTSSNPRVGIYDIGAAAPANFGATANGWALVNSPSRIYANGTAPNYGSFNGANGDVVMMAYDADAGKFWFGANGAWFASGDPATAANPSITGLAGKALVPAVASGTGANVFDLNCGQRAFAYTPPTGFKALNTYNLPDSTIVRPSKHMNIVPYTGTSSVSQSVGGFGFQPDLIWIKNRDNVENHHLMDSVRGNNKFLLTNSTAAERTGSMNSGNNALAFTSDGFSITSNGTGDELNFGTRAYVTWGWKASGATASNTSGTISSTVSTNPSAGFSVVTYTGTGSNATVGHGLGVAPNVIIVKSRTNSAANWIVYHWSLGAGQYILLSTSGAAGAASTVWNNTSPTSSVFSIGTDAGTNGSANNNVAYCWSEISGFSKFGYYTGNGSADGPFVYTGFRPKFILTKRSDSTSDWWIQDTTRATFNASNALLFPNLTQAEYTTAGVEFDILSNGFKPRNTGHNISGGTYIYMAFAENPFKNSLAR